MNYFISKKEFSEKYINKILSSYPQTIDIYILEWINNNFVIEEIIDKNIVEQFFLHGNIEIFEYIKIVYPSWNKYFGDKIFSSIFDNGKIDLCIWIKNNYPDITKKSKLYDFIKDTKIQIPMTYKNNFMESNKIFNIDMLKLFFEIFELSYNECVYLFCLLCYYGYYDCANYLWKLKKIEYDVLIEDCVLHILLSKKHTINDLKCVKQFFPNNNFDDCLNLYYRNYIFDDVDKYNFIINNN